MKTLVKTYFNREEHPCNYEHNDLPSLTVPDQTMSIRTLLERYARGLPLDGLMNNAEYQEGEEYDDMPDPRTLDLSERQEFAEQVRQELAELKSKANSSEQFTAHEELASQGEAATETSEELA